MRVADDTLEKLSVNGLNIFQLSDLFVYNFEKNSRIQMTLATVNSRLERVEYPA